MDKLSDSELAYYLCDQLGFHRIYHSKEGRQEEVRCKTCAIGKHIEEIKEELRSRNLSIDCN